MGLDAEIQEIIDELRNENERLKIENGLLRNASEEQRELNGRLRKELKQMDNWALGKPGSLTLGKNGPYTGG